MSFVCDDTLYCRCTDLLRCHHFDLVAGGQGELQHPVLCIDQIVEFGIDPTLGVPDGVCTLPARRIRGLLMEFDMSYVDQAEVSMSILIQCVEDLRPNS